MDDFIEGFWSKVDIRGEDECWEWKAGRNRGGYGIFQSQGMPKLAHRAAYKLTTGDDPRDMLVCHKCDNPPCCNPNHLFKGTNTENIRDSVTKGRLHNSVPYGWPEIKEIRDLYATEEFRISDLAVRFGISKGAVYDILINKHWHDPEYRPRIFDRSEHNVRAKLNWTKVREIRCLYADGRRQAELCRMFNMSSASISSIVNNKSWIEN